MFKYQKDELENEDIELLTKKKKNRFKIPKYKNKRIVRHGIKFDSIMEADYYDVLFEKYSEVVVHPRYQLLPKFESRGTKYQVTTYVADFAYMEDGVLQVIDVKGEATAVAKIKRKMFTYYHQDKNLIRITKWPGKKWVTYDWNEERKAKNRREKKKVVKNKEESPCMQEEDELEWKEIVRVIEVYR